jgi:transposase
VKTYSKDLRERIVAARAGGTSAAELARLLGISKRSVERYWKQQQTTGSIAPKQRGGYRRSRLAEHEDSLRSWIEADKSITLEEMCRRLKEQVGVSIATTALWHRIDRLGLSYKKNPARRRAGSPRH